MERCKKTLRGLILFTLLFSCRIVAQQFPYGVWLDKGDVLNPVVYDTVRDLGMNTVIQYANGENIDQKNILSGFNLIAVKGDSTKDAVSHYSNGYYTKWEAEDTTENTLRTGIKVNFGNRTIHNSQDCWTSGDSIVNFNTIMLTGPDYRQDKKYKPFYMQDYDLTYTLRIKVAIKNITGINPQPTDPVCKIEIIFRYYENEILQEFHIPGAETVLYVNSFSGEAFATPELIYSYPAQFAQYEAKMSGLNQYENLNYDDTQPETGIQFRVTWYGNKQLYIDYFEVFDQRIGFRLVDLYPQVVQEVGTFVNKYQGWSNINYYFSRSEPQTIDNYTPMKIVDEILQSLGKPKGIAEFYPQYNGQRNGDKTINKFKEMANPEKIMMEFITFVDGKPMEEMYEYQRDVLQQISSVDTGFWYEPLIAEPKLLTTGAPCWLYMPTPEKLNASLMLSLAHGAKGIIFWKLAPGAAAEEINCGINEWVWYNVLLDRNYQTNQPIYNYVKNNFGNRIRGTLGNTLLGLNYTGNFLQLKRLTNFSQIKDTSYSFLKIKSLNTGNDLNFHAGFLINPNQEQNNYFLLTNLITATGDRQVEVTVNANSNTNMRFRKVEPAYNFDMTYTGQTIQTLTFPAGEGYLFEVAPVVKFGGKLVYNETVENNTTLYEDMSIENGATLTVNGTYTANADITVKTGGKIKYGNSNSKIVFNNGAKLILEGNAQVLGLSNTSRLTLQYNSSTSVGVVVNPNASPIISYCNITGPINGITVENEATINVSNVNISNCSNAGIALFHFGNGDSYSTLNTPTIYKCNITNCGTGISIVNCSEVVIKENSINQCNLGLYFNMVSSAYISKNTILGIQSNVGSPMPGISMSSSGGYLRNNIIRYHNFGVLLVYASPDLGMNTIEYNYKCGVYSNIGSFPNLVQQLANPNCWYPIGGCNVIKNNGTFTQLPPSAPQTLPDGAEIFLNSGDVLLSYGFNEISDDRTGIPTYLTIPLIKGTRSREGSREFFVDHNYWGTVGPSPTRFGTLEAEYDPTADYCPLPDAPCSGSELIIQTTDGQIIDTLDSRERESTGIGALEENYAFADKLFYSGNIEGSKTYYLVIVQGNYTNEEKLYAYNKLYEIGEILREPKSYYTELQNAFNSIIQTETDTLLLKAFNQRSILCDLSKEEYLTAINKFDEIIQQNPNSEEAVYAEIDIITTALKMDTTNSGLGKIGGGKYLVKGTSDYLSKLNDILQSKFGIDSEDKKQIIPKEYSLHQNYPNPFNPTTTIKFDIPDVGTGLALSNVTLKVYDILGREVATLVDEFREAGIYEITFDASKLASGVYVYKLQAGDFVSSKKMVLLK